MSNNQTQLLPDSGLPIEKEVERNIDAFLEGVKKKTEIKWDNMGVEQGNRDFICELTRDVLLERLAPTLEEQIRERRENDLDQR